MKKKLNVISIFILIMIVICGLFVTSNDNSNVVKAADSVLREDETIEDSENSGTKVYGRITITTGGRVTISYKYGFSELLILAIPCADTLENGETLKEKKSCTTWSTNPSAMQIIHVSGDKGDGDSELESKTIHLINYFNTYDQLIKLSLVYEFAHSANENFFTPLYCNKDVLNETCANVGTGRVFFITSRIAAFNDNIRSEYYGSNSGSPNANYYDKKGLVYNGNGNKFNGRNPNTSQLTTIVDSGKVIKLDNTKVTEGSSEFEDMLYDTIIPVLLGVLVLCAVISISILGIKIVKSSDEPQERREKVVALRNILIGLAIAFLALMVTEPIINFVKKFIE